MILKTKEYYQKTIPNQVHQILNQVLNVFICIFMIIIDFQNLGQHRNVLFSSSRLSTTGVVLFPAHLSHQALEWFSAQ